MSNSNYKSVSDLINERISCRDFLSKPVSLDLIKKILNTARRTPSNSNLQPWTIYVVHGQTRDKISKIATKQFLNKEISFIPPAWIMPGQSYLNPFPKVNKNKFPKFAQRQSEMGRKVYKAQEIARDDPDAMKKHILPNIDFFGAPVGIFICYDKRCSKGQFPDLGILIGFIMLLCQENGLSTCGQIFWSLFNNTIKEVLDIPDNLNVFCGISIGYMNKESKVNKIRQDRMSFDEMVKIPKIEETKDVSESGRVRKILFGVGLTTIVGIIGRMVYKKIR